MKKSLLALAVLGAFAASAQAQTSITIYGSFDAGVRHSSNVNAAGDDRLTMGSNGTFNSNRIGFRGVEDLGGGLKARFNLETGFNSGTGALDAANTLFNRTASVGIGSNWGWVDFGRQYTNAFQTIAAYDPLSYKYPAITPAVGSTAGTRYNNDIKYTGTFGPVTARAEYALGEVAGSTSNGASTSIAGSYSDGPLAVGAAYTQRNDAAGLDTDHWTVGGAYKFGPARVSAGYVNQEAEVAATTTEAKTRWTWIGLNYAISPAVELTGAYYKTKLSGTSTGDRDFIILAGTYALSKRTNLYAAYDHAKNDGAVRTTQFGQSKQNGISVGMNHLF